MKVFIVLGNGFSIDFIKYLGVNNKIDVGNLFTHGSYVKWPADGESGFLSYKHCPNLWLLGTRPRMDDVASLRLVEDIITCANVFASTMMETRRFLKVDERNITYIKAYKELLQYLKHLFIYYNSCVSDITRSTEWSWSKYLMKINNDPKVSEVIIVTFNYDIWLERLLMQLGIDFSLPSFAEHSTIECKFKIFKPHGSISFTYKDSVDKSAYEIRYDYDFTDGNIDDFQIKYDELDKNYIVTALIPPAGDPARFKYSWANKIRSDIVNRAKTIDNKDLVIMCGLSYWHVDRKEIDELLTNISMNANVRVINPNISGTLNAVITSLFENYVLYPDSANLEV